MRKRADTLSQPRIHHSNPRHATQQDRIPRAGTPIQLLAVFHIPVIFAAPRHSREGRPLKNPLSLRERVRVRASPVSAHTMDFRFLANHGRLRKGLLSRESRDFQPTDNDQARELLVSGSRLERRSAPHGEMPVIRLPSVTFESPCMVRSLSGQTRMI